MPRMYYMHHFKQTALSSQNPSNVHGQASRKTSTLRAPEVRLTSHKQNR